MASFNLLELANAEPEDSLEPDATSEAESDPEGVPVSVLSSSDLEVVNTSDATFRGGAPSVSSSWRRGQGAWGHVLWIPLILRTADQSVAWCHGLGPSLRIDDVFLRGHKYLKRNF